jgi:hypothetical protein
MPTSHFLLLPGELRNRIYSFCIEPKTRYFLKNPRSNTFKKLRPFGVYGSLYHACRQTRAEFGSWYMASTTLQVHQITLNVFLGTFYPFLNKPQAKEIIHVKAHEVPRHATTGISGVQGNIHIQVYFGARFDATLLVQLVLKYPAVKITFAEAAPSLRLANALNELFADLSSGKFRLDFKHIFDRFWVTCSRVPEVAYSLQAGRTIEDIPVPNGITDPRLVLYHNGAPAMEDFAIMIQSEDVIRHSAPSR